MKEKKETEDPFRGISVGSLVKIETGPRSVVGRDALVIDRHLIAFNDSEDMIEDYEANIEVLVEGERVKLWIGWVSPIQN